MSTATENLYALARDEELGSEDRAVLRTLGGFPNLDPSIGPLLASAERRRRGTASADELREHASLVLRAVAFETTSPAFPARRSGHLEPVTSDEAAMWPPGKGTT
jgi:hypothetical protein